MQLVHFVQTPLRVITTECYYQQEAFNEVVKLFAKHLPGNMAIMGGFPRSCVHKMPTSDVDVYCWDSDTYINILAHLADVGFEIPSRIMEQLQSENPELKLDNVISIPTPPYWRTNFSLEYIQLINARNFNRYRQSITDTEDAYNETSIQKFEVIKAIASNMTCALGHFWITDNPVAKPRIAASTDALVEMDSKVITVRNSYNPTTDIKKLLSYANRGFTISDKSLLDLLTVWRYLSSTDLQRFSALDDKTLSFKKDAEWYTFITQK